MINLGSVVSEQTPPNTEVYTGTKVQWMPSRASLPKELGPRGIQVNAINPGATVTEGSKAAGFDDGDMVKAMIAQTPLGRLGNPDDIADVVAFLASDDARWITGVLLQVSGGLR